MKNEQRKSLKKAHIRISLESALRILLDDDPEDSASERYQSLKAAATQAQQAATDLNQLVGALDALSN